MTEDNGTGPLNGITIVDLSMWWSAPLTTELFALMGARVIKVESIQRVDGWRMAGRMSADAGVEGAANFNGVNLNKLGITLDLSREAGRGIFRRLVADADALVENYSPRVMGNLGLTDDVLFAWKPDLVILSMPGFGLAGPWRDYVGFAPTIEQLAGLPELVGHHDGPPTLAGNSLADPVAGYTGALALLTALHERRRTGQGQHVDLSQLESLTALLGHALMSEQLTGEASVRDGNQQPGAAPGGCFPCRGEDRWVVLSVNSDEEFRALCRVIGVPELVAGERFASAAGRRGGRNELDDAIAAWSRGLEPLAAAEILQAAGITAGPVLGPSALLADPHLAERCYWVELDRAVVGRHPHPGLPFQFSATPGGVYSATPTLGRDNRKVLGELLGLGEQELRELEAARVIGSEPLE